MSIEKIYQLDALSDFQGKVVTNINYDSVSDDANTKLIGIFDAMTFIGNSIMEEAGKKNIDTAAIENLGSIMSILSEVGIFINQISCTANYHRGIKDGSGADANQ